MKILWTGVLTNTAGVKKYKIVSAAANNWQQQFITGLVDNGVSVTCLTYLPNRYWPLGAIKPKFDNNDLPNSIKVYDVSYYNLPLIREISLGWSLIKACKRHKIDFDLLITYNPFKRHLILGKFAKEVLKKKWALVLADGSFVKGPNFTVFLSFRSFLIHNGKKFLMQGGIGTFQNNDFKQITNKIIVYTGTVSDLTGIVEFAELFDEIEDSDIKLHIYGKGESKILKMLAKKNRNIVIHGFVNQNILDNAMLEAWAFVNPRNSIEESRQNTFPSKLLDYLRYGRPIISCQISSLTPEYNELLMFYKQNDILSLIQILKTIKSYEIKDFIKIHRKAYELCTKNSWDIQTRNFLAEISSSMK